MTESGIPRHDACAKTKDADSYFQGARIGEAVAGQPFRARDKRPNTLVSTSQCSQGHGLRPVTGQVEVAWALTQSTDRISTLAAPRQCPMAAWMPLPSGWGGAYAMTVGCLSPGQHFRQRRGPSLHR